MSPPLARCVTLHTTGWIRTSVAGPARACALPGHQRATGPLPAPGPVETWLGTLMLALLVWTLARLAFGPFMSGEH